MNKKDKDIVLFIEDISYDFNDHNLKLEVVFINNIHFIHITPLTPQAEFITFNYQFTLTSEIIDSIYQIIYYIESKDYKLFGIIEMVGWKHKHLYSTLLNIEKRNIFKRKWDIFRKKERKLNNLAIGFKTSKYLYANK